MNSNQSINHSSETEALLQKLFDLKEVITSSSTIHCIRYSTKTETMLVTFTSGHSYSYLAVPRSRFDELCYADSVGSFFNRHVKNNYTFTKLAFEE